MSIVKDVEGVQSGERLVLYYYYITRILQCAKLQDFGEVVIVVRGL